VDRALFSLSRSTLTKKSGYDNAKIPKKIRRCVWCIDAGYRLQLRLLTTSLLITPHLELRVWSKYKLKQGIDPNSCVHKNERAALATWPTRPKLCERELHSQLNIRVTHQ
jgi:hypothetical protein